jgi:hypothetical protein
MKIIAGATNSESLLTDVVIQSFVTQPNGVTEILLLRDDGVTPDFIAADGLFSGEFNYDQDGEHIIQVEICNPNLSAIETQIAYNHTPPNQGPYYHEISQSPPIPIDENFLVDVEISVCVNTCSVYLPILMKP